MKTYVITISERFPTTHKRAGELTYFPTKIIRGEKIHTIRANYPLWEKRIKEIEKGNACLSVRVWKGKPYKSRQQELFKFIKEDGVGIQEIKNPSNFIYAKIDMSLVSWGDIANNDSLFFNDFCEWFAGYDLNKSMAIIHFTLFRY